jgi:hypothetical protein
MTRDEHHGSEIIDACDQQKTRRVPKAVDSWVTKRKELEARVGDVEAPWLRGSLNVVVENEAHYKDLPDPNQWNGYEAFVTEWQFLDRG